MISNSYKEYFSFPKKWCGIWIDSNGKKLIIEIKEMEIVTSVMDEKDKYYKIPVLSARFLNMVNPRTKELKSSYIKDHESKLCLTVEA
ncbi:MAG: hypothetical protein R2730_04920 [Chitinophagales bacterium]